MTSRFPIALSTTLSFLFAAPLAIAQTLPAPPAPAPGQTTVAKKTVDPRLDDQTIVCKREETTGSRLGATKECHTRAVWNGRAAQAHEQADRIINTPQTR